MIFDVLIACAGVSVASVWLVQIVTGRWRPVANGFDRLGRFVALLWIAAAGAFAARIILR